MRELMYLAEFSSPLLTLRPDPFADMNMESAVMPVLASRRRLAGDIMFSMTASVIFPS